MHCYLCEVRLKAKADSTPEEIKEGKFESEEHIIPNFCGGKLSSWELLCQACNNRLGHTLDRSLGESIILARLFQLDVDRGQSNKRLKGVIRGSGVPITVNHTLELKYFKPFHYNISESGKLIEFWAESEEIARRELQKLSEKYTTINFEENWKKIKWTEKGEIVVVDFTSYTFGGKENFRAMVKIAVNFALKSGLDRKLIKPLVDYLTDLNSENNFVFFYYPLAEIHSLEEGEVSHILYLKGDRRKNLLYCYIELFSTLNFIVVLNENYQDVEVEKSYCYDLIKRKEVKKIVSLTLFRNPIALLNNEYWLEQTKVQAQEGLKQRLTRVYKIINSRFR